jgi:hypothetical protein
VPKNCDETPGDSTVIVRKANQTSHLKLLVYLPAIVDAMERKPCAVISSLV